MEQKTIKYILYFIISFIFIILSKEIFLNIIFSILKEINIIISAITKKISLILIILLICGLLYFLYKKCKEIVDGKLQQGKKLIPKKREKSMIKNYFYFFLILIILIFLFKFKSELWTFIFIIFKFFFISFYIILKLISIIVISIYLFFFYEKHREAIKANLEKLREYIDDKVESISDGIIIFLDPNLGNAKKLVKLFLSEKESYEYRKFFSKINNFRLQDFQKLFKGQFEYDNDDEINDFCKKYDIADIKGFKLLILKFQNFQIILSEWYEDQTKHEYLEKLWHLYPTIYKLKDKDEIELEKELNKANYSNWNKEDKVTFKQCIENSPEIKAIQFNNYIENEIEEFGTLIGNCVQFNNSFKNFKDMKEFKNKSDNYVKNLLKNCLKFKNNLVIKKNIFQDAIENRIFSLLIEKIVKKIESNKTIDNYFKKMINLMNNNKIKDFISLNKDLLSGINTAFSFFELGYQFLDLIHCFEEFGNTDNYYFNYELRKINDNFEKHKNEITNIKGNDEKDLELILSILKKIKQDRDDILKLIQYVNQAKDEEVEKRNKNTMKMLKRTFSTGLSIAIGAYLTGGLSSTISVTSGIINAIKLGKSGAKLIQNIKQINLYENLLKEMIRKQNEIEKEIKAIKNLYINIKYSHLPKDLKEKIKTKYSEE